MELLAFFGWLDANADMELALAGTHSDIGFTDKDLA